MGHYDSSFFNRKYDYLNFILFSEVTSKYSC